MGGKSYLGPVGLLINPDLDLCVRIWASHGGTGDAEDRRERSSRLKSVPVRVRMTSACYAQDLTYARM